MIAAVILRSHAAGHRRVAQGGVEIYDPVECARSSNPLIYRHAFRLTCCGPSSEALIGKDGCTENLDSSGKRASDDLFVAGDEFIRRDLGSRKARIGAAAGVSG